jgi:hypothetical protein
MAKLAVILPHKDRREFKEFQASYLPYYILNQGIDCKVFFCEQTGGGIFNKSKTLNFGFKFCMEDYNPDYVVVGDIDMVPMSIDYRWGGIAEAWFVNAGGLRILASDFTRVNGYNNNFRGWGYEDSEFWFRLDCFGVKNRRWAPPPKSEMVDLEMQSLDSKSFSLSYFGCDNPRFFHRSENPVTKHITFMPKKTWYTEDNKKRNLGLMESVRAMPKEERMFYFMSNGLNEISLGEINVNSNGSHVAEISYESSGSVG